MLAISRRSVLAIALIAVVFGAACSETEVVEEKDPIVFSDLNWTSAQFQNRVAQYIVEKGYGYPTDVVFGATLPCCRDCAEATPR